MRLFLGIFLPKEVRDSLRDLKREFNKQKRNISFIPLDQLHITLRFIGPKVSMQSFEIIREELKDLHNHHEPFQIEFEKVQVGFDHQKFPKHIMVKVKNNKYLSNLQFHAQDLLKQVGLRDTIRWKERHDDSFHITLGRLKQKVVKKQANEIKHYVSRKLQNHPIPAFKAESVWLVESVLQDAGVSYKKHDEYLL